MTDKTAYILTKAFYNDPLFMFFFPDNNSRIRLAFYTFRFITAHARKKGIIISTSSALEGTSIWLPSSCLNRGLADQIRFGALHMLIRQGKEAVRKQAMASNYMKAIHTARMKEPHLYLSVIGVEEMHRGKGLASQLIRRGLEKADGENLPCYLDTHNENNIGLYEKHGFSVAEETVIPESTVRHWAMIRK